MTITQKLKLTTKIILSVIFISCEDNNQDTTGLLEFDMRLPQDENGYYRGVVHNSGVMADEMVYEYMNYPCYTPCKKQGVCDRVFGCGPDKCRPADARAIGPDSMIWRRCVKPSTRRRGGKSKTKKRKTKKRKTKSNKKNTNKKNKL